MVSKTMVEIEYMTIKALFSDSGIGGVSKSKQREYKMNQK